MADIATPASVLDAPWICASVERADILGASSHLAELATDKTASGETPHPYARVLVLRIIDGRKVWDGFADEQGHWQADGLQPGMEYVAVGIDTKRIYKATAAGPVKAQDAASAGAASSEGQGQ